MELAKKPLKTRELLTMAWFMIGLKSADTTPAMLAGHTKNAIWLVPIASFLILLPSFLLLMHLLKKYESYNLVELIQYLLGSKIGTLLCLLIFLSAFIVIVLDIRNYVEQVNYLYFPNASTTFIFTLFLLVCFIIASKGLESIGSISWMFLPFILFTIIFILWLGQSNAVWNRIFPIFGNGLGVILKEGWNKSSLFLEVFLLTIGYQAFREPKFFRRGVYLGSGLAFFFITSFYLTYAIVFDYNSIENIAFPYQETTEIVTLGHFFTNVSTFFMVGWLICSFLRFGVFLYLLVWIFGAIFKVKPFESYLFPFCFLILTLGSITPSFVANELSVREVVLEYSSPVFFLFPFLLWVMSVWRGRIKQ